MKKRQALVQQIENALIRATAVHVNLPAGPNCPKDIDDVFISRTDVRRLIRSVLVEEK